MFCCIISSIIIAAFIACFILAFSKLDCSPLLQLYEKINPNRKKFKNKVVWIVGSSTGIGAALAEEFAKIGSRLIITATTKSVLEEVKKTCLSLNKSLKDDDILILAYDITSYQANRDALKTALEKFGDIDLLINNAARITSERFTDGIDDELAVHRKIFDINYFANIYLTKLLTKHWIETKSTGLRAIATTSSIGQYSNAPFFQAYIASKMSLCSFYRDLSLQARKEGITVTILCPGPTTSKLSENALESSDTKVTTGGEKLMEASRVAELSIVAIANGFNEVCITEAKWLFMTYLSIYLNYEIFIVFKYLNLTKYFEKRFLIQKKSN